MELDKMKTSWKQVSPPSAVGGSEIEAMLRDQGGSAFYRMKRYNFRTTIFCAVYALFIGFLLFFAYEAQTPVIPLLWVCMSALLLAAGWGAYCQFYLEKIDFGRMDIRTFSHRFYRFRRWEKWEWVGKIVIVAAIIWTTIRILVPEMAGAHVGLTVALVAMLLAAASVGVLIYLRFYRSNLVQVDRALRQLEAFEREDDDILNLTI